MIATLATIVKWAILLPVFLAIVLLAVANDQSVTLHLNPFDPEDPILRVDLALYQVAFIVFALGVMVGGIVAWNTQRKAHHRARSPSTPAKTWQPSTDVSGRRVAEPPSASRAAAFLPRPERG